MSDFRWLIEAPGQRYLAVQRLSMSENFHWTTDHNKALVFRSQDQADALMMAVRQVSRDYGKPDTTFGGLFEFESSLGCARAIEHGWLNEERDLKNGETDIAEIMRDNFGHDGPTCREASDKIIKLRDCLSSAKSRLSELVVLMEDDIRSGKLSNSPTRLMVLQEAKVVIQSKNS